ncbi:hypothetical protein DBV15_09675 [Temnothorax longispinosus]|uniref:Uncharacterized protein n=1 Tax=Temnothorax longispinosus TaxID=300112 RepID=A0A4V3SCK3_9HYME|nr:hypothetical protein DBV15_09675 [Temnothorax longispinosus]
MVPPVSELNDFNAVPKNYGMTNGNASGDDDNHDGVNDLRQTPRRRSGDDWQTAVNIQMRTLEAKLVRLRKNNNFLNFVHLCSIINSFRRFPVRIAVSELFVIVPTRSHGGALHDGLISTNALKCGIEFFVLRDRWDADNLCLHTNIIIDYWTIAGRHFKTCVNRSLRLFFKVPTTHASQSITRPAAILVLRSRGPWVICGRGMAVATLSRARLVHPASFVEVEVLYSPPFKEEQNCGCPPLTITLSLVATSSWMSWPSMSRSGSAPPLTPLHHQLSTVKTDIFENKKTMQSFV